MFGRRMQSINVVQVFFKVTPAFATGKHCHWQALPVAVPVQPTHPFTSSALHLLIQPVNLQLAAVTTSLTRASVSLLHDSVIF